MRSRSTIRSDTFLAAACFALAFAAYAGSVAQGFDTQDPPPQGQARRGPMGLGGRQGSGIGNDGNFITAIEQHVLVATGTCCRRFG